MAINAVPIHIARKMANLTQEDLAKRCGVSESTVRSWEKHRTEPSVAQAKMIAAACGRTYDEIIFLPEDTVKP